MSKTKEVGIYLNISCSSKLYIYKVFVAKSIFLTILVKLSPKKGINVKMFGQTVQISVMLEGNVTSIGIL